MWRIVFFTTITCCVFSMASGKPLEEDTLIWQPPLQDTPTVQEEEDDPIMDSDLFEQRNLQQQNDAQYYVVLLRPPNQKRAMTMLARWGPIATFGKERSSIRNIDGSGITTQTRARMPGQPLRWG